MSSKLYIIFIGINYTLNEKLTQSGNLSRSSQLPGLVKLGGSATQLKLLDYYSLVSISVWNVHNLAT